MPYFFYSEKHEEHLRKLSEHREEHNYLGCQVKIDGQWVPYTEQNDKAEPYATNFDDIVHLGEIENPETEINGIVQRRVKKTV